MKRAGKLFEKICDIQNLHEAYYKASKNKRFTPGYIDFRKNAEKNLEKLRQSLLDGSYTHGKYRHFTITDPKQRLISAASFSDRVIHLAIMNVLEPVFERQFIYHTYACRKNKGTHAAVRYACKKAKACKYFLKLDVRKYFDSIDHTVLKHLLCRIIKDGRCLFLLFNVIDSYKITAEASAAEKSLPIGNLTSQFFANFYLSVLDHYVLEHLKPDGYVRYMDDIVLFGNSTAELKECFLKIRLFCREKLFLELKPRITGETKNGVSFLGYLITCRTVKLTRKTRRRKKQKIKILNSKIKNGTITEEEYAARIKCIFATAFA